MSKVICDVCGTTYAETAAQCPICGCARNTTDQTVADSVHTGEENGTYTYVKGGRFSKGNVRKRNKNVEPRRSAAQKAAKSEDPGEGGGGGNKVLVAIVIILLLAIVAVASYIGIRYLVPAKPAIPDPQGTQAQVPGGTTVPPTTALKIPCTEVVLNTGELTFNAEGEAVLLDCTLNPANTTEKIQFSSSDESVATVTEGGKVEAVGGGEAVITVTCGSAFAQCKVTCAFGNVTPPTTTVPPVTLPADVTLELKYKEFAISERYPNPVGIYKPIEGIEATDITWTVEDPKVAAVSEKGVVSAVGRGSTVVWAQLGDQKASCKVHVQFDPKPQTESKYKVNKTDVSIKVGETFSLVVTDSVGAKVNVEWTASEEEYVSIDGTKIKGLAHTQDLATRAVTLTCTIEEETFSCIIRVYPVEEATE